MLAVAECCNGVASASSPPQAASPKALCSSQAARHQMPPRLLREEDTPRAVIAASAAEDACTATRAACLPDISGGGWAHRAAAPVSVPGPPCSRPLPPVQDTRKVRLRSLSTTSRFQPLQCFAKVGHEAECTGRGCRRLIFMSTCAVLLTRRGSLAVLVPLFTSTRQLRTRASVRAAPAKVRLGTPASARRRRSTAVSVARDGSLA